MDEVLYSQSYVDGLGQQVIRYADEVGVLRQEIERLRQEIARLRAALESIARGGSKYDSDEYYYEDGRRIARAALDGGKVMG